MRACIADLQVPTGCVSPRPSARDSAIQLIPVLLALCACVGEVTDFPPGDTKQPMPPQTPSVTPGVPTASIGPIEVDVAAPTTSPVATDAGKVDAGHTVDAGHAADAGHGGDAGVVPNRGAWLFSDDFENGLDAGSWSLTQEQATVKVDSTHAAGGTRALHSHVQNIGQNTGFAVTNQRFPLAGQDTFIRAFVYIETPLTHHAQIIRLWNSWANGPDLEVLWDGSNHRLNFFETWYYEHTSSEPNDQQYTSSGAPTGAWHCWEWEIDATTNTFRLWLDEAPVNDATVPSSRNWTSPVDSQVSLGWAQFHDETSDPNGFDTWVDEVVVSRAARRVQPLRLKASTDPARPW